MPVADASRAAAAARGAVRRFIACMAGLLLVGALLPDAPAGAFARTGQSEGGFSVARSGHVPRGRRLDRMRSGDLRFPAPIREPNGMSRHVVAATSEIPPGGRKLVTVKGRPIAIFNLGGEYFGLFNRCPHQGGSLCDGKLTGLLESPAPGTYVYSRKGEILRCPWHGWEFDIRTGQSYCDPDRIRTRAYPVQTAPGSRVVAGPYVAETVPVRVEDEYVVVEV
jgi:3-phenylpropionate/trans-cinnamate dioxygenase ferredoxin subunit